MNIASPRIWSVDDHRKISFSAQKLWGFVEVEHFEMRAPLSTDISRLRHARAQLAKVSLKIPLSDLELLLRRRLINSAFNEIYLQAHNGCLICWGVYQPKGRRATPFYLEGEFHPSSRGVRFEFYRGYVLGVGALNAAELSASLYRDSNIPALQNHPSVLHFDPLTELSLTACLEWGWKLPKRSAIAAIEVKESAIHYHVNIDEETAYIPSPAYRIHLQHLKLFHEGELLLHRGEREAALQFFKGCAPHAFATQRVTELGLAEARLRLSTQENLDDLYVDHPTYAPFAEALSLEYNGDRPKAGEALLQWSDILRDVSSPINVLARDPQRLLGLIHYSRGLLLESSNAQESLAILEDARQALPESTALLSAIAQIALRLGDHTLAQVRLSEQAQSLSSQGRDRESAWVWIQLGELWRQDLRTYENAERAFLRALELAPDMISAYQGLAGLAEERGQNALACKYLDQAIEVAPKNHHATPLLEEMIKRLQNLSRPAPSISPMVALLTPMIEQGGAPSLVADLLADHSVRAENIIADLNSSDVLDSRESEPVAQAERIHPDPSPSLINSGLREELRELIEPELHVDEPPTPQMTKPTQVELDQASRALALRSHEAITLIPRSKSIKDDRELLPSLKSDAPSRPDRSQSITSQPRPPQEALSVQGPPTLKSIRKSKIEKQLSNTPLSEQHHQLKTPIIERSALHKTPPLASSPLPIERVTTPMTARRLPPASDLLSGVEEERVYVAKNSERKTSSAPRSPSIRSGSIFNPRLPVPPRAMINETAEVVALDDVMEWTTTARSTSVSSDRITRRPLEMSPLDAPHAQEEMDVPSHRDSISSLDSGEGQRVLVQPPLVPEDSSAARGTMRGKISLNDVKKELDEIYISGEISLTDIAALSTETPQEIGETPGESSGACIPPVDPHHNIDPSLKDPPSSARSVIPSSARSVTPSSARSVTPPSQRDSRTQSSSQGDQGRFGVGIPPSRVSSTEIPALSFAESPEFAALMEESKAMIAEVAHQADELEGPRRLNLLLEVARRSRDELLDLEQARDAFWKVLREAPIAHRTFTESLDELYELFLSAQDWEGLLLFYQFQIDRGLENAEFLHLQRAATLRTLDRLEEAVNESILAGDVEGALPLKVELLSALGRLDEAVECLTDTDVELSEEEAYVRQLMAARVLKQARPEQASQLYEILYETMPSADLLEEWLEFSLDWGDSYGRATAIRAHVSALSERPNTERRRARSLAQFAHDVAAQTPLLAIDLYQEALEITPEDLDIADRLSTVSLERDQYSALMVALKYMIPLCLEGEFRGALRLRLLCAQCVLNSEINELLILEALEDFVPQIEEPEQIIEILSWAFTRCNTSDYLTLIDGLNQAGLPKGLYPLPQ